MAAQWHVILDETVDAYEGATTHPELFPGPYEGFQLYIPDGYNSITAVEVTAYANRDDSGSKKFSFGVGFTGSGNEFVIGEYNEDGQPNLATGVLNFSSVTPSTGDSVTVLLGESPDGESLYFPNEWRQVRIFAEFGDPVLPEFWTAFNTSYEIP